MLAKGPCELHGMTACSKCVVVEDAGKRMAEIINLTIACRDWDELSRGCATFYLDDGDSDGSLYPDRKTALEWNQLRPVCVFHFRSSPGGVNARDCQIFLNMHREAYENDRVAWTDTDSPDLIISDKGAQRMRGNY